MKYDNSIILKSICNIFKNNVTLNVIGNLIQENLIFLVEIL